MKKILFSLLTALILAALTTGCRSASPIAPTDAPTVPTDAPAATDAPTASVAPTATDAPTATGTPTATA